MDINKLKLYTKNLDSYTATDVDELEPMTDKELDEFQYEIEHATGNTSDWDRLRAVISFREIIHDFEVYAEQMRNNSVHWQGEYNRSQGIVFDKKKEIEKLELEISKLLHFKEFATKYLTEEQLIEIENFPDTD